MLPPESGEGFPGLKNGLFRVHTRPGRKKEGIFIREVGLEVDLSEVAREGKANERLLRNLADWLDLPLSSLCIKKGHQSRFKTVSLSGLPDADIDVRLRKAISRFS
ncbi:MAG: DUF167 domain-containing protein [Leptospirales bacterium]